MQKEYFFKSAAVQPPTMGWLQVDLNNKVIEYLNRRIDVAIKDNICFKDQLAGHISTELKLVDEDNYFYNNVLSGCIDHYYHAYPAYNSYIPQKDNKLHLKSFWVNFQKKHEFNPSHNHSGIFSFVIWMKIPTEYEDQCKLDFLKGVANKSVSNFELRFLDILGDIRRYHYYMGSQQEGKMLFFPAKMEHAVYPFYESDGTRISISGNIFPR